MAKGYIYRLKGLIQGVGFRPYVFRLATKHQLQGYVKNLNDGVEIGVSGQKEIIDTFVRELVEQKPEIACIEDINLTSTTDLDAAAFEIRESSNRSHQITRISPDLAVCPACLEDMKYQERRKNYPFTNCTYCGPRFSIIEDLPYDRQHTTMEVFEMCEECAREYHDISDRRFHAQPIACHDCGPKYRLKSRNGIFESQETIIERVAKIIDLGGIVAIKGIGGYFIACDANNELTVTKLRKSKKRYGKPFAVMFRNMTVLREYAFLDEKEEKVVQSIRRPIVLLKVKKKLALDVCRGLKTIGAMLPYMPVHYLLFEQMKADVMVLTSGNFAEEPIITDDALAEEKLGDFCDAVLSYNRTISNRVDDSVVMVVNEKEQLIRRSRGYVPTPVITRFRVEGILAMGAELSNCFAIGKSNEVILSQHIGDLQHVDNLEFLEESIHRFQRLFRFEPELVAVDLHPDYLSGNLGRNLNLPLVEVQHHHAHVASCMAEHQLDEPVIGVSFDGTGFGTDGKIWGGEFMCCDCCYFERFSHLDYMPLPGGDAAIKNPWRIAIAYLLGAFENIDDLPIPVVQNRSKFELLTIKEAIEKDINVSYTSSAGRLFDAISAILGYCEKSTFHAEAPMRMESKSDNSQSGYYDFDIEEKIDIRPIIRSIVYDLTSHVKREVIAGRFQNTIVEIIVRAVLAMKKEFALNKVILSGGLFQNKYILAHSLRELEYRGLRVFTNQQVPVNDGGIALGQMIIAAKRRKLKCV